MSDPTPLSDVPENNGQLSAALKERLAQEDLQDLEVLFRYRGVRTMRSLLSLESNDRAVLLTKARDIYEILGFFPSNLKSALEKIFGNGEASSSASSSSHPNQVPLVPGTVASAAASGSSTAYHAQTWANGSSSSSTSTWAAMGPHPTGLVGPGPVAAPSVDLAEPLPDDCHLKRDLKRDLEAARETLGRDRYVEVCRRLRRSDDLVSAGCLEAAEALAALTMRKEDLRDRDKKELLKAAKKVVRDVLLWRCCGNALGLDSREALVRAFEEAVRHTNCDENTVSQLTNGYRRIREELAGGPQPGAGKRAGSPARKPGRQKDKGKSADGGDDADEPSANASSSHENQKPVQKETLPAVATQAMSQRAMFELVPGVPIAPGAPIRGAPGLEPPLSLDAQGPSKDDPLKPERNQPDMLGNPSHHLNMPADDDDDDDDDIVEEIFEAKFQMSKADKFVVPAANGHLAKLMVRTLLKELEFSEPEFYGPCATWLADLLAGSKDVGLTSEVMVALAETLQRGEVEDDALREVMQGLVRIAGLEMPRLLLPGPCEGGPEGVGCELHCNGKNTEPTFVPVLAEVWSCYLADAADTTVFTEVSNEEIVRFADLTKSLVQRCERPAQPQVAWDCCRALRVLVCVSKDNIELQQDTADWISETVIQYSGYPGVMHEGFTALLEICKVQNQLFGLDLSDLSPTTEEQEETFAQRIRDSVMGLVRTCEAKKHSKDTTWKAIALLAHTHSFEEVMRQLLKYPGLPAGALLSCLLDEVARSLEPTLSTLRIQEPTGDTFHEESLTILRKVQQHGGVGVQALMSVAPTAAAGGFDPNLQLLVQWVDATEESHWQERFFLIGLLFDVKALLPILAQVSADELLFTAACAALQNLNHLRPLDKSSRQAIADWVLTKMVHTPSSLQTCTAWVRVIGMAFHCWATSEVSEERDTAEQIGKKVLDVLDVHKRRPGREGWQDFLHEAIKASNSLLENDSTNASTDRTNEKLTTELASRLKQFALEWKVTLEKEARVLKQANLLLEKV